MLCLKFGHAAKHALCCVCVKGRAPRVYTACLHYRPLLSALPHQPRSRQRGDGKACHLKTLRLSTRRNSLNCLLILSAHARTHACMHVSPYPPAALQRHPLTSARASVCPCVRGDELSIQTPRLRYTRKPTASTCARGSSHPLSSYSFSVSHMLPTRPAAVILHCAMFPKQFMCGCF